MSGKKELGQYFTINQELQDTVFHLIKFKNQLTLEPSIGRGDLIIPLLKHNPKYPIIGYEIDTSLQLCIQLEGHQQIYYEDFLKANIQNIFKTIIGNPPYVKVSRSKNLYIQFIERCFELMDDSSEMIMIVPSDFIKLTSASKIIQRMLSVGSFTSFYYPQNEGLFDNCNVDIMVFRYEKGIIQNTTFVNEVEKTLVHSKGIITFRDLATQHPNINITPKKIEDLFDVFVGIVSGMDDVYRQPFGNIDVIIDKTIREKFIFIDEYPSGNPQIDEHLAKNKERLLGRRIKKFNDNNWYEWGAPRNLKRIRNNLDEPCIYIRCLTRHSDPAFIDKVQYFGGTLLCLLPRKKMSPNTLAYYRDFINHPDTIAEYTYSGRFKIGQKQVCQIILAESYMGL